MSPTTTRSPAGSSAASPTRPTCRPRSRAAGDLPPRDLPPREYDSGLPAGRSQTVGEIVTILVVVAGLSAFAMLAAWFVRDGTSRLWLVGGGRGAFWERTPAWPAGVP